MDQEFYRFRSRIKILAKVARTRVRSPDPAKNGPDQDPVLTLKFLKFVLPLITKEKVGKAEEKVKATVQNDKKNHKFYCASFCGNLGCNK